MKKEVLPVGVVKNRIRVVGEPGNKELESRIILSDNRPSDAYDNIVDFSHLEIMYYFDMSRQNSELDKAGESFSNYSKNLGPALFGNAIVRLISKKGKVITVKGLDALNGTCILDLKPVMGEFLPREEAVQPDWAKKIL